MLITLDFETFWSQDYTLSKSTPIEYLKDPRFRVISCAIKVDDSPTEVYFGDEIDCAFEALPWDQATVVAHNGSEFDHLILAWYYGIDPQQWACTLAMARPLHAKGPGGSLKALAEHYGLQAKGSLEATNTKGKRLEDFSPEERALMRAYNARDVDITYDLYQRLRPLTPERELWLIDLTTRMLVDPKFELDRPLLERVLAEEQSRREGALMALAGQLSDHLLAVVEAGPELDALANRAATHEDMEHDEYERKVSVTLAAARARIGDRVEAVRKFCASAARFKLLLTTLDIEVPMKISPTTGKPIPALAKTDQGMQDLLEHPNPLVAQAAATRLDVKSTLLESRIQRLLAADIGGKMPIPLRYYGADTTGRWSGTAKLNLQNLPRVNPKDPQPTDCLRRCLRAPPGHQVVVADLSGIELRVNHILWGSEAVALWEADPVADLYKDFAAKLFGVSIGEVTKDQRHVAKLAHLGLGYGASTTTFQRIAKLMGGLDLTAVEAKGIVDTWRATYHQVVAGWKLCGEALKAIHAGSELEIREGLLIADGEGIILPTGKIRYPNLRKRRNEDKLEWVYGPENRPEKLYGAKCDENVVQALSRHVLTDAIWRIAQTPLGQTYRLAHTVHDELIYVVPSQDAQAMLDCVQQELRRPPAWWPELILWSEGDIGVTYADCK